MRIIAKIYFRINQQAISPDLSGNYSAGGSKGPARPLGGVRGAPPSSPTPPEAAQETRDLNRYSL